MIKRQIVKIDKVKCNGCGLCANACHEGAIAIVDGKAKLIRDDYCDGMGDCLPSCPMDAISFEYREALAYDEKAVMANIKNKNKANKTILIDGNNTNFFISNSKNINKPAQKLEGDTALANWPIQIKLAPIKSEIFDDSKLLVAASCSAFSVPDFHKKFLENNVLLIGCPKLDNVDYSDKLSEIIKENEIKEIRCVRMEVPCCAGLSKAVESAIEKSGKKLTLQTSIVSKTGLTIG